MAAERDKLDQDQVAQVFHSLAAEHAREREPFDKRRAWQYIERAERLTRREFPLWRRAQWLLIAAAVTLCVWAGNGFWKTLGPLRYQAQGVALRDGVLTASGTPARLDFSDGSRIDASVGSVFSADPLGKHAALSRLVQGQLHVSVHHASDTNWHFIAGPYDVQVVGTEFDLGWDPKTEVFTLSMINGEVRVLGAPGATRVVRRGEKLRLPELAPAAATPRERPAAVAAAEVTPSAVAVPHNAPPARWDLLVTNGRFASVVQSAEFAGIEQTLKAASPSDLKALAQAARYTGHTSLSLRAWQSLRDRFHAQSLSTNACFFLGRGYEEQGNGREALRWLATYLSESPAGVYASEALGRKLLLLSKLGEHPATAQAAHEYLARFPQGAYAASARVLIQAE